MRAPAEFGRLAALADEAVNRPRVDKLSGLFRRPVADLGVPLGDVDGLDTQELGQRPPFGLGGRLGNLDACVFGNVDEGLLDKMGHQAWVRAVCRDNGACLGSELGPQSKHLFALCVV